MTGLEPRTPHQPEKLKKLSKNDPVVLFLISKSIESVRFYLICFQSSAGGPQGGDRILCTGKDQILPKAGGTRVFAIANWGRFIGVFFEGGGADCGYRVNTAPDKRLAGGRRQ